MSRLQELDLHLFAAGNHARLWERLGAHPEPGGVGFGVWAPNAREVSVICAANAWGEKGAAPLEPSSAGVWQGSVKGLKSGDAYKYRVLSRHDAYRVDKADPLAFRAETPPATASVVWPLDYQWGDAEWMKGRAERQRLDRPQSVYEVHLGSWRRVPEEGNRSLTYRELAPRLADYARAHGFTHVELMPVMEHPFYGSWGYEVTGFFAPSARWGTPQDFMFLVDTLHQAGVGVVLDWPPAHFPKDEHGLGYFDGTHLYEHADPRKGFHPDWGSAIFNYGRNEVRSFLTSCANYWLERVSRRRAAGRRGGLDALPRLRAQAGRVAAQREGRPREPRGDSLSPRVERGALPRAPRHPGDRRGVHRLADGDAPHLAGRPRLRPQVGHGLHARHPRLLQRRPDAPALPPRAAHLSRRLRPAGELRAAALARRGGAREGLAA